ncbi:hypothetical protein [Jatrophihabitans fulvus]
MIPDYGALPGGSESISQPPADPDCPAPTSCVQRPAPPAVLAVAARALRPLIADPSRLSVVDTVTRGGVFSERSITAAGGGRGLAVVVSRRGREPDIDGPGSRAYGHGLVGDYVVSGTLVSRHGVVERDATALSRLCRNPLLAP